MKIEELKEKARRHEQREEWQKALDLYREAIRRHPEDEPEDINLFNRVGDLQTRLGQVEGAVQHYEKAIDLYLEAELPNNAIAICKKVIRNLPERHIFLLRMGQIRAQQGFLTDARQSFFTYAERATEAGDLDGALNSLIEFVDLSPDDLEIRMGLAAQLESHGRKEQAVEQLSEVHRRLVLRDREEEAEEVASKLAELNPDLVIPHPELIRAAEALRAPGEGVPEEDFGAFELGSGAVPEAPSEAPPQQPVLDGRDDELGEPTSGEVPSPLEREVVGVPGEEPLAEEMPASEALEQAVEEVRGEAEAIGGEVVDDVGAEEEPALEEGAWAEEGEWREEREEEALEPLPTFELPAEEMEEAEEEPEPLPLLGLEPEPPSSPGQMGEPLAPPELSWASGEAEAPEEAPEEARSGDAPPEFYVGMGEEALGTLGEQEPEPPEERAVLEGTSEGGREGGEVPLAADAVERAMEEAASEIPEGAQMPPVFPAPEAEPESHEEAAARGDLDRAVELVRARIEEEPDDVAHHQRLVEYAFRKGDDSVLIPAYLSLADSLARTGSAAKARAVYQQVLALAPEHQEARLGLASVEGTAPSRPLNQVASSEEYVDLGSLVLGEEVEKTTRWRVTADAPSGDDQADFAKMLRQFKEKVAEHVDAGDVAAHHDLGTAYMEMGLLEEAISEFQMALRAKPDHLPTFEVLGRCWMEMGKPDMAARSLGRALQVESEVEDELIGIYYLMGRAKEELGENEEAAEFYDKVFALDINFMDVTERLRALR